MPRKKNKFKKKTLKDLPNDWAEIALENGEKGGYIGHLTKPYGISLDTILRLRDEHPKFDEVLSEMENRGKCYLIDRGNGMMEGAQGNGQVWKFAMQNRMGWSEKRETALENRVIVSGIDTFADILTDYEDEK